MKYLSAISFLIFLFSCQKSTKIDDGIYVAKNNELFYAVDINNLQNQIKIYTLPSYSEINSRSKEILKLQLHQTKNSVQNYKTFSEGKFKIVENNLIIENLESDILPTDRPKNINAKISKGQIFINCADLNNYTLGNSNNCEEREIIYIKKQ